MVGPLATFADSVRAFVGAIEAFIAGLANVSFGLLAMGIALHGLYLSLRTRGWFNALRAAYPSERFRWRNVWAAADGLVGGQQRAARRVPATRSSSTWPSSSIPRSTYSAVAASFLVEAVFDWSSPSRSCCSR